MDTGLAMLTKHPACYTLAELLQLQVCPQRQRCPGSHSLRCHTRATKVPLGDGDSSASTVLYTLTHEVISTPVPQQSDARLEVQPGSEALAWHDAVP